MLMQELAGLEDFEARLKCVYTHHDIAGDLAQEGLLGEEQGPSWPLTWLLRMFAAQLSVMSERSLQDGVSIALCACVSAIRRRQQALEFPVQWFKD